MRYLATLALLICLVAMVWIGVLAIDRQEWIIVLLDAGVVIACVGLLPEAWNQ